MASEISISVPAYDPGKGVASDSEGGDLAVMVESGELLISGDPAGLRDLARWCLAVSAAKVGSHVHLDPDVDLVRGSVSLVVELVETIS
jgi:hypothetical protein